METHSNADTEHSVNSSSDQSDRKAPCVAEAALRDGEKDFQDGFLLTQLSLVEHRMCSVTTGVARRRRMKQLLLFYIS